MAALSSGMLGGDPLTGLGGKMSTAAKEGLKKEIVNQGVKETIMLKGKEAAGQVFKDAFAGMFKSKPTSGAAKGTPASGAAKGTPVAPAAKFKTAATAASTLPMFIAPYTKDWQSDEKLLSKKRRDAFRYKRMDKEAGKAFANWVSHV